MHRQLRSMLPSDYVARMREVFANGARMLVMVNDSQVVSVAIWRLIENTYVGLRL